MVDLILRCKKVGLEMKVGGSEFDGPHIPPKGTILSYRDETDPNSILTGDYKVKKIKGKIELPGYLEKLKVLPHMSYHDIKAATYVVELKKIR